MEHHRDAKEGTYVAEDSLKCKSEPIDHYMFNGGGGDTFGFYWAFPTASSYMNSYIL